MRAGGTVLQFRPAKAAASRASNSRPPFAQRWACRSHGRSPPRRRVRRCSLPTCSPPRKHGGLQSGRARWTWRTTSAGSTTSAPSVAVRPSRPGVNVAAGEPSAPADPARDTALEGARPSPLRCRVRVRPLEARLGAAAAARVWPGSREVPRRPDDVREAREHTVTCSLASRALYAADRLLIRATRVGSSSVDTSLADS
jgi:hypothetical protein